MEIIPQEKVKTSNSLNILFYFGLVILFFSIASFFILNHLLGRAQKELTNLEIILKQELPLEKSIIKEEVLGYQKRIANFSFLIDQKVETLGFFKEFEKIVHPNVWFSTLNLSSKEGVVALSGQAKNFEALEQQFFIIQNTNWIKSIDLGTVAIGDDGKIDFNLSLFLDSKIFKQQ